MNTLHNIPNSPEKLSEYQQHYSESKLLQKIKKVASTIGINIIYPIALLYTILKSGKLTQKEKTLIIGALGYFILPVDLIADFIPILGFTDDLMVLISVINMLANHHTTETKQQTLLTMHQWVGPFDESTIHFNPQQLKTLTSIIRFLKRR